MQCAVRDALIAFMAATAQAQAEATREAQRAGIAHAKANGDARAYWGRKPSYSRKQFEDVRALLGKCQGLVAPERTLTLINAARYGRDIVRRKASSPNGVAYAVPAWKWSLGKWPCWGSSSRSPFRSFFKTRSATRLGFLPKCFWKEPGSARSASL